MIRHPARLLSFLPASGLLALTLGLNLLVFGFVNALWLRPLPFREPDQVLTMLEQRYSRLDAPFFATFESVAGQVAADGFSGGQAPAVRWDALGSVLAVSGVTDGYFGLLGVAIRGRDFTPADNVSGGEAVAIISDRLWASAFHRSAAAIGTVVKTEPLALRVIGVAAPGFVGARRGEVTDMWVPAQLSMSLAPIKQGSVSMDVLVRMHPGDSAAEATDRLRIFEPKSTATLVPLPQVFGGPQSKKVVVEGGDAFSVVAALSALVAFGGCAAVAAVLLVLYERRQVEFVVKAALGASRAQLVRALMAELVTVAIVGAAGALAVSAAGARLVPSLQLPGGVDLSQLDLSLDWRVLLVSALAATSALAIAAALPVARFSRLQQARSVLSSAATTAPPGSERLRQALLAVLVAATVVVLVSAALFIQAVRNGLGSAPGFDVAHTMFVSVRLPAPRLSDGQGSQFEAAAVGTRRVSEALRSVGQVEHVALTVPPVDVTASKIVERPVRITVNGTTQMRRVGRLDGSVGIREALGLPLLLGRDLQAGEGTLSPLPALVTTTLARSLWPGENPLGQTATLNWPRGKISVVGIVPDFAYGSLTDSADGVVFTVALMDAPQGIAPRFVLRTSQPAERVVASVRQVMSEQVPDVYLIDALTGREAVSRDLARQRLGAWFFSAFGVVALGLGVGSVFGLSAYIAESRRRECAVRLALGASPGDLVRLAVFAALVPVAVGVCAGSAAALVVSRVYASTLVGLGSSDPLAYGVVSLAMMASAVLAALFGAWRLRRVVPAEALKAQ